MITLSNLAASIVLDAKAMNMLLAATVLSVISQGEKNGHRGEKKINSKMFFRSCFKTRPSRPCSFFVSCFG